MYEVRQYKETTSRVIDPSKKVAQRFDLINDQRGTLLKKTTIQRFEPPLVHTEEMHLGGEIGANGLSGGHLLSKMQQTWGSRLVVNPTTGTSNGWPWNATWSIKGNAATPKASTMFPTKFDINLINQRLSKATRSKRKPTRISLGGFSIYRRANTIYPIM